MTKKTAITLLIIFVLLIMIIDFNINGSEVFEKYFKQMETESMKKINEFQHMDFESEWAGKTSEQVINTDDINELQINNIGSIKICGEKRDDIEIKAVIMVYAERKEVASDFLSELKITDKKSNGQLKLVLNKTSIPTYIEGIKVDYEIKAPDELSLQLENRFGEMDVSGFASNLRLSNRYKIMKVSEIDGDVALHAKYGDLYVRDINGEAIINNSYNNTMVNNIESKLTLDAKYSDIKLNNITGDMLINTSYGKLEIEKANKDLELNSRYTKVNIFALKGAINADLDYGDCGIRNIINDVNLNTRYTDLYLTLSPQKNNYLFDCFTEYGDIDTDLDIEVIKEGQEKRIKDKIGKGDRGIMIRTNGKYSDLIIDR